MKTLTLRLIFGDQLNSNHSWFKTIDPDIHYIMMEMGQELEYTTHHIQKIIGFFLAMRNFKQERESEGHTFIYFPLDHSENNQNLVQNLNGVFKKTAYLRFEYQLPDEYRLDFQIRQFCAELENNGIQTSYADSEHFLTTRYELSEKLKGKKTYLMETFYRDMRRRYKILMQNDEPEGKIWNLDAENRKPYNAKIPVPPHPSFFHPFTPIKRLLDKLGYKYLGSIPQNGLPWPISRKEALQILDHFVQHLLPFFGTFEDAMVEQEPNLFHSRLSFALNLKLVHPMEVIQKAITAYKTDSNKINLAQVEGFIRQILGWREFMRGQYWHSMPNFSSLNFFDHQASLPNWFWSGKTRMNCLRVTIQNSLEFAYAHHIQRLMITGNFALLAGINPDELDSWYLGIYIDAIEWVEITNTRGMSQFADGGKIASKPYVSGANYISKMSNYCNNCHYSPKIRYGEGACPFNSLYWNFFQKNQALLSGNNRLALVYKLLEQMDSAEKLKLQKQASFYLENIHSL